MGDGLNRFANGKWRKGKKRNLLRRAKMRRPKHILWEYDWDGMYREDRIKGREKRRLGKWYNRTTLRQDLKDAAEEMEQS